MKNSKWMRFLLIALSVAMVLSLFACGGGNTEEETTVDNTNDETTVEDTTVADDTTVEDTTVEDTTVEDTTVEDTTVEDTTVEDTTVEDTTVEDTTVEDTTVEDTTVEDTTVEDTTEPIEVNVDLTPNKLAGITNVTNVGGITLSEDGSYVTVTPVEGQRDVYFYAYHGNTAVTGRYAIIKYRTSSNVTHFNVYASTSRDGATNGDDLTSAYIIADGEWHVMLVDLAAAKTVTADDNGEYTVKFLRIDPFKGGPDIETAESVDIAYVGVHDGIADLDLIANSNSILELGNQFTFSMDKANVGGTIIENTGFSGETVKTSATVSRDNANIVISTGWIAVNGHAFTNMGVYYRIVDANGNATRLTKAGMNIKAAEVGVINHCANANPGATPMRIDTDKGGFVLPDLKDYSGQTVTVYIYAISDDVWAEHGVIAGRVVLTLTVTVEKSEKAQIGDVVYEDIEEAFAALKDGDTIKLLKDVTLPTAVVIDKNITVNLNGKTISIPEDTDGSGVFHVVEGGVLTINGNGTVNGVGKNDWNMALWVDGGKAIINGGTFTNVGAGEDTQYDLIYVKGGELVINGGTFIAETPQWTINCNDSKPGTVTVNGGTFYKFDPSNTKTEPAGADNNFVADDLYAKADGDNYVVVPTYADLDVVWTGKDLLTQLTDHRGDFTAVHSVVLSADGTVRYTKGTTGGDSGFSFYVNNTSPYNDTVATGQYFVIKYRTNSTGVLAATLFASTTQDGAKGVLNADFAPMNQFFGDNEWHVAVIDLASVCAGGVTAVDGVYYVNFIRLDLTNRLAAGEILDIAYAGFCDSLDDIYAGETKVGLAELTADYRASVEGATAGLTAINPNESIFRTVTSNNIAIGGWIGRRVSYNSVVYKIVDANGVETAWTVDEGAIRTPEGGLADVVTGFMNSPNPQSQGACYVYRVDSNIDLSAYAGQTVTVYVANANVVDGSFNAVVPMFTITANVPQ